MATSGAANPVPFATAMARLGVAVAGTTPAPVPQAPVTPISPASLTNTQAVAANQALLNTLASDPTLAAANAGLVNQLQTQAAQVAQAQAQTGVSSATQTALAAQTADIAAKAAAAGLTGTYANYNDLNAAIAAKQTADDLALQAKNAGLTGTYATQADLNAAVTAKQAADLQASLAASMSTAAWS